MTDVMIWESLACPASHGQIYLTICKRTTSYSAVLTLHPLWQANLLRHFGLRGDMMAFNGLYACEHRRWPMTAFDSRIGVGLE